MEEENTKKNFEIVGDSQKKVVRFGAPKTARPVEKAVAESKEEGKPSVNDRFAKYSIREELEPGEYSRELKHQLSINSDFEVAFEKLEEGAKAGYLQYFAGPKLTASITNRIVKKIDRIIKGHGLTDCTCGLSKTLPNCDGSHKGIKVPE